LQLTLRSPPPYPWPPEQAQSGVSKPYRTTGISDVPEASTWAMMIIGFAGLAFVGYRASRSNAALA
jgi:hypothetical protein